jgi:general stress protein 26
MQHSPDVTKPDSATAEAEGSVEHLNALIAEFSSAMLVTHQRNGALHARPMALASKEADGILWFITSKSSPKVEELVEDARALVSFQDQRKFAALNGFVELTDDPEKIRELWKESYRAWFGTQENPEVLLLRFTPYDAEYWDNSGMNGLRYIFRATRALLNGKTLAQDGSAEDPRLHAKLDLWAEPTTAPSPLTSVKPISEAAPPNGTR